MTTTTGGPAAGGPAARGLPASGGAVRKPPLHLRLADWIRSHEESGWRWSARIASGLPLAALVGVVIILAFHAAPAIRVNGWRFFTSSTWNPGSTYGGTVVTDGVAHPAGASYGALPIVVGTLQSSFIAVVIALPISIGAAFALTERLPRWVSRPLGFAVEVLAGIPSVIIGLWGILTLGPWLSTNVYPPIADNMPDVPILRYFRNPVGHGEGLLTAGIVLALMIVPIITATTRDLFVSVPPLPKEGAEALGMTDAEVARRVTLPWVRSGIVGATVLGLGRALGETIAVAMVSGAILGRVAPNIYGTMTTMAATIVTQLDGAQTDGTGFALSTLAELGLVLALISILVNAASHGIVVAHGSTECPGGSGMTTSALQRGPGQRSWVRAGLQFAFRAGTVLALLLILAPAAWVLIGVVRRALPHWQWDVLWTTGSDNGGGLLNAILGTLLIMVGVLILAGTIGILTGLHLAEMAKPRRNGKSGGRILRSSTEILSGFPSIVLGYVGYVALVVGLHWGFSLLAALIVVSIMVIPYIAKSTEVSLRQVPTNYREGAEALGMSTGYALRKVIFKTALPGIVTGLLLAMAIAGGETAPLLYTANWSNSVPKLALLHEPVGYLTYPVWTYYNSSEASLNYLAYDAALILIVLILVLLVASRILVARTQRHAESRG